MTAHALPAPRLIIEHPEAQTGVQFATGIVVTLLIWGAWIWLTWPFLGLCLMKLGIPIFTAEQRAYYSEDLLPELADIARWCVEVLLASAIVFLAWIAYHVARFSKQPHQRKVVHTPAAEVAQALHVPDKEVGMWQTARKAVIRLEENGSVPHIQSA